MPNLLPWPVDRLHLGFFSLQAVLSAIAWRDLPHAAWWIAFDCAAVLSLVLVVHVVRDAGPRARVLGRLLHGMAVIPVVFTQVGLLIHALTDRDCAPFFERLDEALFFGHDPLEALEAVSAPWLTEIMQVVYTIYILLAPATVILLAVRAGPRLAVRSLFGLLCVFYLSYVGYYLFPTSGPNIHNNFGPLLPCGIEPLPLYVFRTDLPGIWATAPLREWMFKVELTKRDCFPSGHAAVAVACWIHARRVGPAFGRIWAPFCLGVVLSTVYLRYHYVIDLLAGVALALLCVLPLESWHRRREDAFMPPG